MITDLRLGSCIVTVRSKGFVACTVSQLGESSCELEESSTGRKFKAPYDTLRPVKITKRWLRDNEFDCTDENPDAGEIFKHRTLPAYYNHADHRLFVYGHIFPVKVKFVHHLQNAFVDCGIDFVSIFRDSHCTQIDSNPITFYLGGLRVSHEFFDTNSAFGLVDMPKIQTASLNGSIRSNRKVQQSPGNRTGITTQNYKDSFVAIMGIQDESHRRLARYFYDYISLDDSGKFAVAKIRKTGDDSYRLIINSPYNFGSDRSDAFSLDEMVSFLSCYHDYIRANIEIGLIFDNIKLTRHHSGLLHEASLAADISSRLNSKIDLVFSCIEVGYFEGIKDRKTGKEYFNISIQFTDSIIPLFAGIVSLTQVTTETYDSIIDMFNSEDLRESLREKAHAILNEAARPEGRFRPNQLQEEEPEQEMANENEEFFDVDHEEEAPANNNPLDLDELLLNAGDQIQRAEEPQVMEEDGMAGMAVEEAVPGGGIQFEAVVRDRAPFTLHKKSKRKSSKH